MFIHVYSNDSLKKIFQVLNKLHSCGTCYVHVVYSVYSSLHLSLSCVFPEPSLTPHNLSTVLHSLEDGKWMQFGICANMPYSELSNIQSQYDSQREYKQAVCHSLISDHPAPSWDLVAHALYQMGSDGSHRALEHLQQLFPTGIHVYNFLYILVICTCTLVYTCTCCIIDMYSICTCNSLLLITCVYSSCI